MVPFVIFELELIWESHSSPLDHPADSPAFISSSAFEAWPFTAGPAHGFSSRIGSTDGNKTVGKSNNESTNNNKYYYLMYTYLFEQ